MTHKTRKHNGRTDTKMNTNIHTHTHTYTHTGLWPIMRQRAILKVSSYFSNYFFLCVFNSALGGPDASVDTLPAGGG